MNLEKRKSQNGSSSVKFIGTLVVLFLIGNAIYNYGMVAYDSANLRQEMHAAVMQGLTIPPTSGTPVDVTKRRIQSAIKVNNGPVGAFVEVKQINGVLQARVAYVKQVPVLTLGLYDHQYQFDHITNSTGFLSKE